MSAKVGCLGTSFASLMEELLDLRFVWSVLVIVVHLLWNLLLGCWCLKSVRRSVWRKFELLLKWTELHIKIIELYSPVHMFNMEVRWPTPCKIKQLLLDYRYVCFLAFDCIQFLNIYQTYISFICKTTLNTFTFAVDLCFGLLSDLFIRCNLINAF